MLRVPGSVWEEAIAVARRARASGLKEEGVHIVRRDPVVAEPVGDRGDRPGRPVHGGDLPHVVVDLVHAGRLERQGGVDVDPQRRAGGAVRVVVPGVDPCEVPPAVLGDIQWDDLWPGPVRVVPLEERVIVRRRVEAAPVRVLVLPETIEELIEPPVRLAVPVHVRPRRKWVQEVQNHVAPCLLALVRRSAPSGLQTPRR